MLNFLHYFGFDSDDPVIQVYLQLAKFFINDLTLDRIIRVSNTVIHGEMGNFFSVREKSGNFEQTGKVREFYPK